MDKKAGVASFHDPGEEVLDLASKTGIKIPE
jgi:hypothetical protein